MFPVLLRLALLTALLGAAVLYFWHPPPDWRRQLRLLAYALGLSLVLLLLLALPALAAGEQIGTAVDRLTNWVRGLLVAVGILVFVIGAAFFMIEGTTGGQARGKALMVAAVVGVLLGFLAGPIVDLAGSFVR